jgi:hypothetical protein
MRPTGVGGGDDHRGGEQLSLHDGVGIPTTVVYARELSQPAIMEGVKAGHVFIQVTGPDGVPLYLTSGDAMMGDAITATAGKSVAFKMATKQVVGAKLKLLVDGRAVEHLPEPQADAAGVSCVYQWTSDGKRHWVRAELHDSKGEAMTLTNPIYVNWDR